MGHAMMIKDYRLTTAKIYYHLPDHPGLLQIFVWQQLDLAPDYPALKKFLDFWASTLHGKLHSVEVASVPPRKAASPRHIRYRGYLH
jgi:uncharacterized protein Usg